MELIIVSGDKFCLVTVTMGAVPLSGTFFHPLVESLGTSHQLRMLEQFGAKSLDMGNTFFQALFGQYLIDQSHFQLSFSFSGSLVA